METRRYIYPLLGLFFLYFVSNLSLICAEEDDRELLLMTVATEETDGFLRFIKSTKKYDLHVKVVGMGKPWKGGDVANTIGGGHKVNLIKPIVEEFKDNNKLIIMFVDSYDVILTNTKEQILKLFDKFNSKIVFSTEDFCWPNPNLATRYPEVKLNEKRFLNSGGFIGYAPEMYQLITARDIADSDDDQLYYTELFLDQTSRDKYGITLDNRGEIFQNLNGALGEVKLKFKGSNSYLYNEKSGNTPIVIHGNGPIKPQFNSLANYLMDQWTPLSGCQSCREDTISLEGVKPEDFPQVMLGLFIPRPTPFVEDFLERIMALNYPKAKMDVFLYYAAKEDKVWVDKFVETFAEHYHSIDVYSPLDVTNEWDIRNKALEQCLVRSCQYFFNVEAEAHLEDEMIVQQLVEANRSVIAPLLLRPGKLWSNFWGALSSDGFYKRSDDYFEIINKHRIGQWNVPYISGAYMIQGSRIPKLLGAFLDKTDTSLDPDMAFCKTAREKGVFLFVDNQNYAGHLVNSENYQPTRVHSDLYELFDNKYTWELKYLHENWSSVFQKDFVPEQPCPDVYWFPLVKDKFCHHLIEEMETLGEWSGGKHEDARLNGGYENVPTDDIHTNQIGWETHWLQILKDYIGPLSGKVYDGYFTDARAIMNFVVRYRPDRQDRLRPHHDSSTYTINLALNTPGIDYQGGGVNFLRYNCTVTNTKKGWLLMHPGRLTHLHEGLQTTGGTRYIMISFIDP